MYELYTLDFFKSHSAKINIGECNIVLGSYEDISFNHINDVYNAEKLFNISQSDTFYIGRDNVVYAKSQVDCPSNMLVLYSLEKKDGYSPQNFWDGISENEYIGVTLLSCYDLPTKELKNRVDDIHRCAQEYGVSCSCLGTLGIYKYCILFKSNDIEKIVSFSNNVQSFIITNKKQISTSYTLVISRQNNKCEYLSDKKCNLIANIQITYKNSLTSSTVLKELSKKLIYNENNGSKSNDKKQEMITCYTTLGEYDICIHVPVQRLPLSLYKNGGLLCSDSEFFKNNILQSCTRIAMMSALDSADPTKEESTKELISNSIEESYKNDNTKEVVDEIVVKLNEIAKREGFYENKMLQRLLHLINVDFQKAYALSQDRERASDLKYIFKSTITCLDKIIEDDNSKSYQVAAELAEILSNSIYNMFQNSTYIISEPYSFLHNSSVFQDVLQSYLGFVKTFLIVIYSNCNCKQSELIPIVSFDHSVTVPMSKLFIYKENKVNNENNEKDEPRIIYIQLPIDATTNEEIYIPLLVHEVMHYVCPINRCERNKIILKIYMKHYYSLMLRDLIEAEDELSLLRTETDLYDFVFDYIDKLFDVLCQEMEAYNIIYFNRISMSFSDSIRLLFDTTFSKYKNDCDQKEGNESINSDYLFDVFYNLYNAYKSEHKAEVSNVERVRDKIVKYCKNFKYNIETSSIIEGIKEEICDTMMIKCFDLNISAYLALIIIAMINQNINNTNQVITIVRIGSILKSVYKLDLEKFDITIYTSEIKSIIFKLNPNFIKYGISNRIDNIISNIGLSIEKYKRRYKSYSSEIDIINQCYDFNRYCNIEAPVTYITEKYESALTTFYYVSRKIKTLIKYASFYSKKTSNFRAQSQIKIMELLCDQLSLEDIRKFYDASLKSRKSTESIAFVQQHEQKSIKPSAPYKFYIHKYGIEKAIHKARKTLLDSKHPTETLWYRGQVNESWEVYPSLYRKKCKENFLEFQNSAYELFRAQAYDSFELHSNTLTDADWIACMQHYFIPTNFLDWSEQPLTSLYFALENHCSPVCNYQENNLPVCNKGKCDYSADAALYVLNPYRMNRVFKQLSYVPNISIPQNIEKYRDFILPDMDRLCPFVIKDIYDIFPEKFKGKDYPLSPMAVITSNMSSRIKAQKGHFVAYNLRLRFENQEELQESQKGLRNLLDLYAMEEYLYEQNIPNFEPFIVKLVISNDLKPSIAETLRSYGIKKSDVYPELMNIGDDISNFLFGSPHEI